MREKCRYCGGGAVDLVAHEENCVMRPAVANALSNALENGHDFKGWSDEAVADDMMDFDADVAEMPRDLVVTAIHGLRS